MRLTAGPSNLPHDSFRSISIRFPSRPSPFGSVHLRRSFLTRSPPSGRDERRRMEDGTSRHER